MIEGKNGEILIIKIQNNLQTMNTREKKDNDITY